MPPSDARFSANSGTSPRAATLSDASTFAGAAAGAAVAAAGITATKVEQNYEKAKNLPNSKYDDVRSFIKNQEFDKIKPGAATKSAPLVAGAGALSKVAGALTAVATAADALSDPTPSGITGSVAAGASCWGVTKAAAVGTAFATDSDAYGLVAGAFAGVACGIGAAMSIKQQVKDLSAKSELS